MTYEMSRVNNHNNVAENLKEMKEIHQNKNLSKKNIYMNQYDNVCRNYEMYSNIARHHTTK